MNNEEIIISRDKRNPTWAWVWNNEKPKQFKEEDKVILLDVFKTLDAEWDASCLCVEPNKENEDNYKNNFVYNIRYFKHYQITEKPIYRKFETLEEYIEATKNKGDLRIISKNSKKIINLDNASQDSIALYFCDCRYNSEEIFKDYVWLNDKSPVGVKCS